MSREKLICCAAILLSYYFISGMATTNILRLLKGSTLRVNAWECRCASCGGRINVLMQQPIFSYLVFRGRCRYCGAPIPKSTLALELTVFAGMSLITLLLGFSRLGVLLSFAFFELVRAVLLLRCGHREEHFVSQYITAVAVVLLCLLIVEFKALLLQSV